LHSADLSRANLSGAYLLKASLRKAYLVRATLSDVYLLRADLSEANLRGADLRRADLSGAYLSDTMLSEANLSEAFLLESHLIRTNLEQAEMTGCCIDNWHINDVDLSKVDCRYVYQKFNHATKSPSDRFPIGRDFEPGELGQQSSEDTKIEIRWSTVPNWEALAFTLTLVEQEQAGLRLTIAAYQTLEDGYLLRLAANFAVNPQTVTERILAVYTEMLQSLLNHRSTILNLLQNNPLPSSASQSEEEPTPAQSPPAPNAEQRLRVYNDVTNQIQRIIYAQSPEQIVGNVQRLLNFLTQHGFATEEIQRRIIGQAVVKRARNEDMFQNQLLQWDEKAEEIARTSAAGVALRQAIALLLSKA
jgi:hypothetical protein